MKFIHIADLHIGKRVNEFSMLEDQKYILNSILDIVDEVKPTGILLAGDIYDKSVPAGEAVEVLDEFLTGLAARQVQLFIVSGNHDSPERLNFGSRIMEKNGVHIAGTFDGTLKHITLEDEEGPVHIYLLPFIKPALVSPHYPEEEILSYEDAVKAVINACQIDTKERNILVAHQFITNAGKEPERCDSETLAIGGLDNIGAAVFEPFDYVALGHLHGPQSIGRDSIRYAGSPLKYSFSEVRHHKSVTIVEFAQKGTLDIKQYPLTPMRDMREIKGPLAELIRAGASVGASEAASADTSGNSEIAGIFLSETGPCQDYVRAILTDEEEVYDAIGKLRQVYPNMMRIDFENSRSRQDTDSRSAASGDVARKSPLELFEEFYAKQNELDISEEQCRIMLEVLEQVGGINR